MYRLNVYLGDSPVAAQQVASVKAFVEDYYRDHLEPDDVENVIVTWMGTITLHSDLIDPLRHVIDFIIDAFVFESGFHFNLERLA